MPYLIRKRKDWTQTPVTGRDGNLLQEALLQLEGQRATEDEVRFALDVYAEELGGEAWRTFQNNLPDLLAGGRIEMDREEIQRMKMAVVARIKEELRPAMEAVKAEAMASVSDFEKKWGIDGLSWGIGRIAEKRLVSEIMRLSKDDKQCQCGHHEKVHPVARDGSGERPCRRCQNGECSNFRAAGREESRW